MPVSRPYMPNARRAAELMQSDLAKVGIGVEIVSYEWGEYLKKVRDEARDGAVILGGTSDNGDPDNFLGWHFMPEAVGKPKKEDCYNNPKVAQLLIDGRLEADQAKREKIYQEAEKLIHDDVARIAVVWVKGAAPFRKEVKGYVPVVFRSWYEKLWTSKK